MSPWSGPARDAADALGCGVRGPAVVRAAAGVAGACAAGASSAVGASAAPWSTTASGTTTLRVGAGVATAAGCDATTIGIGSGAAAVGDASVAEAPSWASAGVVASARTAAIARPAGRARIDVFIMAQMITANVITRSSQICDFRARRLEIEDETMLAIKSTGQPERSIILAFIRHSANRGSCYLGVHG
ncbi:hypothetical protein J2X37_000545 [Croceicoccus sp. BE223]|nr:hypothetical protein [Croceicoccus sp. BE223]